jgi:hypothetical protein
MTELPQTYGSTGPIGPSRSAGQAAPDHRLYGAMIEPTEIVVGLSWFRWCVGTGHRSAVSFVGIVSFAWGKTCLFVGDI